MNKMFAFVGRFFDRRIYVFGLLFFLLFFFDFIALQYSLYFHYRWIDVPVHFLGGFFLGALFFYIVFSNKRSRRFMRIERNPRNVLAVTVLCVFVAAVGWEVLEFIVGRTTISPAYVPDTVLDIAVGTFGGLVFYFLYKKIKELIQADSQV